MLQLKSLLSLAMVSVALFPDRFVYAIGGTGPSSGLQNPIRFNSLAEFFAELLNLIVQIGFPFVVLAVVYSGFLFIKAQGNPEELQKAKTAFFWTIVGALLVLGAAAVSALISNTITEIIG